MALLEVVKYPSSIIRKKCEPVIEINDEIIELSQNMAETMYAYSGIGLAAPQIAVLQQLIVLDIGEGLMTLVNPEITMAEGSDMMDEGCLCLPKLTAEVDRSENVQVKGINLKGEPVCIDAEGLLARVFQHEIDHLQGMLFIDRISKLKRDIALKQYKKLSQE